MDKLLLLLGVGFILWCIGEGIVRIIRASRGSVSGGKEAKLKGLLADIEEDLIDARKRIEVLESIVTDGRRDLRKQIDDLAN